MEAEEKMQIVVTNSLSGGRTVPSFLTNSLAGEHYHCHTRDLLQNFLNEAGIFRAHSKSFVFVNLPEIWTKYKGTKLKVTQRTIMRNVL